MSYIDKLLSEWAYRVHDGKPNPKNIDHIWQLRDILLEWEWDVPAINQFVYELKEAKRRTDGEDWELPPDSPSGDWAGKNQQGKIEYFSGSDAKAKAIEWAQGGKDGEVEDDKTGTGGNGSEEDETGEEGGDEETMYLPKERNISKKNQKIIDSFKEKSGYPDEIPFKFLNDEQKELMNDAMDVIEVIYDDDASDEEKMEAAQWLIDNVGLTTNSNKKKAYFNKLGGRRKIISGKHGTVKARDLVERVEALTGTSLGTYNAKSVKQGFTNKAKPDLGEENIVRPEDDPMVNDYFENHELLKRVNSRWKKQGIYGVRKKAKGDPKGGPFTGPIKMPSSDYAREYLELSINNPALQNVIDYAKELEADDKVDPAIAIALEEHQTRMKDVLKNLPVPSEEAAQAIAKSYNTLMVELHKADPEIANSILKQIAENNLYEQEIAAGEEVYLPAAGSFPAGDKLKGGTGPNGTLERVTFVSCKWGKEGRIYGCPANAKTIEELHQDIKKQNNQGQYESEPGYTLLIRDELIRVDNKKGKIHKRKTIQKTEEFITTTVDEIGKIDPPVVEGDAVPPNDPIFTDKEKKKISEITTAWMKELEKIRDEMEREFPGLKDSKDEYWEQFAEKRKKVEKKYMQKMGKVITEEHVTRLIGANNIPNVIQTDGDVKPSVVLSMIEMANNIRTNESLNHLEHNKQYYDEKGDPHFETNEGTQNPNDYSITFRPNRTKGRAGGGCQLSFTGDGTPPPVDLTPDGVLVDHETGQEIEA